MIVLKTWIAQHADEGVEHDSLVEVVAGRCLGVHEDCDVGNPWTGCLGVEVIDTTLK